MNFHIISIFPDTIDSYVNESIIGRAVKNKIIKIHKYSLRQYTKDKHKRVDGIPFGGGPGMVMWLDPLINVNKKIIQKFKRSNILNKSKLSNIDLLSNTENKKLKSNLKNKKHIKLNILIVNFNIAGYKFDTAFAKNVVNNKKYTDIIFLCGRYEGIDDRINSVLGDMYNFYQIPFEIINISIGDYVLTGGELPAMIMIDSISRQIDGVLNDKGSLEEERISSRRVFARPERYVLQLKSQQKDKNGLIKKDQNGKIKNKQKTFEYCVPEVLLSGNHKKIDEWRQAN